MGAIAGALLGAIVFAAAACAAASGPVDANTATSAELDAISGIGPALAARIVEERRLAPFRSLEDLQERVRGVGENNLRKMRENGLAVSRVDAANGTETIVGGLRDTPVRKRAKRKSAKKTSPPGQ
jgi:hypothetical protein